MRTESDFIGSVQLPIDALYGINAWRASQNFPDETRFPIEWYKAVATVKLAVYQTYRDFFNALKTNYPDTHFEIPLIGSSILNTLIETADELTTGQYFDHFIVPAVQGGAGTAINMNINEIITNVSLKKLGYSIGQYDIINPFEHANVFQSTNDVIPTALTVSVMQLLELLESNINTLRAKTENLERTYRDALRIAYTQLQQAVPTSFGKLFGSYNDALSRDWWRISKCFERIKVVNLGGSAVGTSISVPRYVVMEAPRKLQQITKLPITASENLPDTTSNLDAYVEVHGILKAHAVNLEKIVSDLRLMASGLNRSPELILPDKQTGSSIMPGKVNPVIAEFVISAVRKVYANDVLISSLAGAGNFELNAYLPQIGFALIESLKLLIASCKTLSDNMIDGLKVNVETAKINLYNSPAITAALNPYIGYMKSAEIAKLMKSENLTVFGANERLGFFSQEKIQSILSADKLLKNGFSISDLL